MKEKPPPKYFEVEPPSGVLLPGQTLDIRIKFMPSEEVMYMYTCACTKKLHGLASESGINYTCRGLSDYLNVRTA